MADPDDKRPRAPRNAFGPYEKGARTRLGLGKTFVAIGVVLAGVKYAYKYYSTEPETMPFLRKVQVVPYGVLGSQLSLSSPAPLQIADAPDSETCIFDPAGLHHIKGTPRGAGGAAASIYKWLGISNADQFPAPVRDSIFESCDAKYHKYGDDKHVVHVIGPDFREGKWTRPEAVQALSRAYRNALQEFTKSNRAHLRMVPISGGIFSGSLYPEMPNMTIEALEAAYQQLHKVDKEALLSSEVKSLNMCVFSEREWDWYVNSLKLKTGTLN
eukprot:PhM_4_TR13002/c0_g1_i1/m.40422